MPYKPRTLYKQAVKNPSKKKIMYEFMDNFGINIQCIDGNSDMFHIFLLEIIGDSQVNGLFNDIKEIGSYSESINLWYKARNEREYYLHSQLEDMDNFGSLLEAVLSTS